MCCLWAGISGVCAQDNTNKVRITLRQAIQIAQLQSVDAAVALNELRTAYWEFRTHRADQLPEVIFTGTLPSYSKQYSKYQQSDGSYTYVQNNALGLNGEISIAQNIALTGGKIALNTSLDFTRQLGSGAYNEFMSVPVSLTLTQPIFGVNDQKWKRRIEPVRYQEAKAAYMENVENVTIATITNYFNLLLAEDNLDICNQNLLNANKLYDIAVAKRKIGHISESELMRLKAKGKLTEAQSNYNAMMFKLRSFLGMSEQDVIEPVLPEAIEGVRMDYQAVLEKAQENNSFSKNIMRRQLEADYDVATAKGNRRSINLFASVGYTGKDMSMRGAYNPLKDNQIVEATIPMKGTILRVEPNSTDMYVSIDLVEEVIERQLRKYKTKIIGKHKDGGNLRKEFIEKENEGEEEEVKIIRTKQFGMKPMFPEDACVQMELLGHSFFVFRNADTDEVNVVYKRKGNTYGLIEPEC